MLFGSRRIRVALLIRRTSLLLVVSIIALLVIFWSRRTPTEDEWEIQNLDLKLGREDIAHPLARRSKNITIVIVIEENTPATDYSIAINSVECYAAQHRYGLKIIKDSQYPECTQKDMMFRRHCIVAEVLVTTEWILFIDADMAVVNPNRLIEEYVDDRFDIIFYDRFINWEVAAGSYLVRNTSWTRKFLLTFAEYENRLPASFHGTDNGALHTLLAETLYPDLQNEIQVCLSIWEQSTGYDTLFQFEGCLRAVIGLRNEHRHVKIFKKGTGWVRDIWLTESRWSPDRDFMLHALQNKRRVDLPNNLLERLWLLVSTTRFAWHSPFTRRLDVDSCRDGKEQWAHDPRLQVSKWEIDRRLAQIAKEVERDRWKALGKVRDYVE